MISGKNIFENIPAEMPVEMFEIIQEKPHVKIERILSKGQVTAAGEWLCQPQHEWVILLQGEAQLCFKKDRQVMNLRAGDYIQIASGIEHRVEWTHPDQTCIWLAIHYDD